MLFVCVCLVSEHLIVLVHDIFDRGFCKRAQFLVVLTTISPQPRFLPNVSPACGIFIICIDLLRSMLMVQNADASVVSLHVL
jgi:hypothetical protein